MSVIFIPDPDFPQEWAESEDARRLAEDYAEAGLRHAKSIAPVRTGAYRNSLRAEVSETSTGWVGMILSDDPAAPFIEFGTERTPTFATLRRALESTGARRSIR